MRVLQRTSELAAANTALQEQMQRHIQTERAYQEIMDNSIDVICTGGTGLGLAIAAQLVGQMGGRIWVESTLDTGSTFHFTAQLPVRDTPIADGRVMDLLLLKGLRVLVVDDNEINRRILRAMLENWGMLATIVASGLEGIEEMLGAMRSGRPFSLVLLDGIMPEMDGFMVAEKIREHGELSSAVIMMLSSGLNDGAAARCRKLRKVGYFIKPVSEPDLLDTILLAVGGNSKKQPATVAPLTGAAGSKLHILLAEDNVVNRIVAAAIIGQNGHTLVHAINGREAVEAASKEAFDLIFMDVQMPEMDGFEATVRIRESEQRTGAAYPPSWQ